MKYFVFGAGGSIGGEVVGQLMGEHHVFAGVRTIAGSLSTLREGGRLRGGLCVVVPVGDVANVNCMFKLTEDKDLQGLDGIVYAVGHCPPGGFMDAVKRPLSELPIGDYEREIGMHQVGVLNVFQYMLQNLNDGGCFVFISSAITRLKGKFPQGAHPDYHASVIAAEDWLIEGMRRDPVVIERKLKIHRIAPAGVDTPFHEGGFVPKSQLFPVSVVAREVLQALASDENVDKQLVPETPQQPAVPCKLCGRPMTFEDGFHKCLPCGIMRI